MTIRLIDGADIVEIDPEQGGRVSSLAILGRERIATQPCSDLIEPGLAWGSFLMAPWVGRVRDGLVEWRGLSAQLTRNHGSHAIHGVVFDEPVEVIERDEAHVALACRLDRDRWPFGGRVVQRYRLAPRRLEVEAEIVADEPMPAALGWHPWFVREPGMTVRVDSARNLATGEGLIPTGESMPLDAAHDLRGGRAVDELLLDDVYVSARSPAILSWPDLDLAIGFDRPLQAIVVYTHPSAVCVEPQTSWPDAIRLSGEGFAATGLAELGAGQSLSAQMTWSWRPR